MTIPIINATQTAVQQEKDRSVHYTALRTKLDSAVQKKGSFCPFKYLYGVVRRVHYCTSPLRVLITGMQKKTHDYCYLKKKIEKKNTCRSRVAIKGRVMYRDSGMVRSGPEGHPPCELSRLLGIPSA